MAITEATINGLQFIHPRPLTFKAAINEIFMGALRFSKLEPGRNTPCSKFYALKLHWFCSWVQPKCVEIIHCPTQQQKAGFLTKALGTTAFKACRLLSMGW